MAWEIIWKSFVVILVLMIVAQGLYAVFHDKSGADNGDES